MKLSHSKRYTTFLFSGNTLYIAKLDSAGKSFVLFSEIALPKGLINAGVVQNTQQLTQFILAVKKQVSLKDKQVVIGISEEKATTRSLILPPLSLSEISQAIAREAGEVLPFPYKDEYLDWKFVEELPDHRKKVLISAIPKGVVDGYVEGFTKADLWPVAFETTSLSLFRLLPQLAQKGSFALELGELTTVLVLGLEGTVEATSVISGDENLLAKLKKTIAYYQENKVEESKPTAIYFCGKRATTEVATFIQQQFQLQGVVMTAGVAKFPEAKQVELAVLASLCRKEVADPSDVETVNVLPDELVMLYHTHHKNQFEKMLEWAFLVAMVLFTVALIPSWQLLQGAQASVVSRTVSAPKRQSEEVVVFSPSKVSIIKQLSADNKSLMNDVATIFSQKPDGLTLTEITYQGGEKQIILSGLASSRDSLLAFKQDLEKTASFSAVTIPISSLQKQIDIEFRIVLSTAETQMSPK